MRRSSVFHVIYVQESHLLPRWTYFLKRKLGFCALIELNTNSSLYWITNKYVKSAPFVNGINKWNLEEKKNEIKYWKSYLIWGSGLPPDVEHTSSIARPSVATGLAPGEILGGWGGVRTVTVYTWECKSCPLPAAFRRHSNFPLSLSKLAFEMIRS